MVANQAQKYLPIRQLVEKKLLPIPSLICLKKEVQPSCIQSHQMLLRFHQEIVALCLVASPFKTNAMPIKGDLVTALLSHPSTQTVPQSDGYHYQLHHTKCTIQDQLFSLLLSLTISFSHLQVVVEMFHQAGFFVTSERRKTAQRKVSELSHLKCRPHLHRPLPLTPKKVHKLPAVMHLSNDNRLDQ